MDCLQHLEWLLPQWHCIHQLTQNLLKFSSLTSQKEATTVSPFLLIKAGRCQEIISIDIYDSLTYFNFAFCNCFNFVLSFHQQYVAILTKNKKFGALLSWYEKSNRNMD